MGIEMVKTAFRQIDDYFIGTGSGTTGDRIWFFGSHGLFIALTLIVVL